MRNTVPSRKNPRAAEAASTDRADGPQAQLTTSPCVPCVANPKLTILASAPTEDGKATSGAGAPAHEARGQTGRLRTPGSGLSGASGTSTSKRPSTGIKGGAGSGRFAQAASRRHRGGGSAGAGIRALTAHVSFFYLRSYY